MMGYVRFHGQSLQEIQIYPCELKNSQSLYFAGALTIIRSMDRLAYGIKLMIKKSWDKLTADDINQLVDDAVPEDHTLDYKEELPNESPKSELDFLCDVAAFANASGGDLIFGIREKRDEGKPTATPEGFAKLRMRGTLDEVKRRLESLIRSGISPTLTVQINHFDDLPEGAAILVRVPASWSAPHMVTCYNKNYLKPQFYKRHNGGNHPMDIGEIRAAFTLSESRIEKLRRFRDKRLELIKSQHDSVPHVYGAGARMILHILPVNLFDPATSVDISKLESRQWVVSPAFPYCNRRDRYFNFDGYFIQDFPPENRESVAYVQIFRGGAIESVRVLSDYQYIGNTFEVNTIRQVKDFLKIIVALDVPPPIFIMLTLLGVKGYPLHLSPKISYKVVSRKIDREILPLPECMIDDFGVPIENAIRQAFNALYQAAGMSRSFNYDEGGKWVGEDIGFK